MVASYRQPRRQGLSIQQRLKQGLVGYWPTALNGAVYLPAQLWGDGAQPSNLDLTNNATVTRVAGPTNNLPDGSHYVVASAQALTVANNVYLQPRTSKFAAAIWAKPDGVAVSGSRVVFGKWGTTANLEWAISHLLSSNFFSFSVSTDGTNATTVTVATVAAAGSYYFIAAWWDGARVWLRVYFTNGTVIQNSAAFTGPVFAGASALGVSSLFSSAARWSGDAAAACYWIGTIPTTAMFDWLYNNGQGRDLARGI